MLSIRLRRTGSAKKPHYRVVVADSKAWRDGRFVWQPGEWIALKPGHEYRQHRWVQVADGQWKLTGGDWVKTDKDEDDKVAGKK